jgi:cell division protease FtsH
MLQERKPALIALTDRLIEVESVDSVELKRIMDENSTGPMLVPGTETKASKPDRSVIPEPDSDDQDRAASN